MALANGALSGALLVGAAGKSGASLRWGTAVRWNGIRNEVFALHGWYPEVTSAGDGYRTLARQRDLFLRNYTQTVTGIGMRLWDSNGDGLKEAWWRKTANTPSAATPGTSNHGLGTTVDVASIGSINQFNHPRYLQFAPVAQRWGFSNTEGRSIGEPWHWSDIKNPDDAGGTTVPPAPTQEVEDVALTQAEINAVGAAAAKATWEYPITGGTPQTSAFAAMWLRDARLATEFHQKVNALAAPDPVAIATALAPKLAPLLALLPDADLERIAAAVCDEQSTRLAQ
jgi:hypothetical protein